jgi:hypothetical protein
MMLRSHLQGLVDHAAAPRGTSWVLCLNTVLHIIRQTSQTSLQRTITLDILAARSNLNLTPSDPSIISVTAATDSYCCCSRVKGYMLDSLLYFVIDMSSNQQAASATPLTPGRQSMPREKPGTISIRIWDTSSFGVQAASSAFYTHMLSTVSIVLILVAVPSTSSALA